jgi:hypothetical protein
VVRRQRRQTVPVRQPGVRAAARQPVTLQRPAADAVGAAARRPVAPVPRRQAARRRPARLRLVALRRRAGVDPQSRWDRRTRRC